MTGAVRALLPQPGRDHRPARRDSPARRRPSCSARDHGFGPTDEVFYVNTWLEQNGYLYWADDVATTEATGIGFDEMTRHIHTLDWSRTLAYAATPSSQGIHAVVPRARHREAAVR